MKNITDQDIFCLEVLRFGAQHPWAEIGFKRDSSDTLRPCVTAKNLFAHNCPDYDVAELTPANFKDFKIAFEHAEERWGKLLFLARFWKRRPRKMVYYGYIPSSLQYLFEACGPENEE